MKYFSGIIVKGCIFHFAKAIVSKVQKKGFKGDFSNVKANGPFCGFIRAILGLPYVPPERMNEGIRNLYILCRQLTGKQRSFGIAMIKYVESTWIRGSYPVITWNVFNYDGVTTNNNSEAYNRKLGAKLNAHPNVYVLMEKIKEEMVSSRLDALAAQTGNRNVKSLKHKKNVEMQKRREVLKEKLKNGKIELRIYQQSMGGLLTFTGTENDDNVDDHFFSNNLDVPDDPIEVPSLESIYVPLPSMHTEEPGDEQDNNTHFDHSAILNHQSQANARTKKTNSVSQVEFRHVNASRKRLSELTYSIRGANLRKKRRNNDGMAVACNLQVEAMIDIDITPTSSKEDIKEFFGLNSNDKLTLEQGELLRDIRLREINFYLSENETPKDGNCQIAAIRDQVEGSDHVMKGSTIDDKSFREKMVLNGYRLMKRGILTFSGDPEQFGSEEDWRDQMMKEGTYGDQVFLQVCSIVLSSNIYIFSCIKESAIHNKETGVTLIKPLQDAMNDPIYIFFYSESDFVNPHFESIYPHGSPTFLEGIDDVTTAPPVPIVAPVPAPPVAVPVQKRRGRPRGSRNKPKNVTANSTVIEDNTIEDDNSFMIRRRLQNYNQEASVRRQATSYCQKGPSSRLRQKKGHSWLSETSDVNIDPEPEPNTSEVNIVPEPELNIIDQTRSRVVVRFHRTQTSSDWDHVEIPESPHLSSQPQISITPPPPHTPSPPRPIIPVIRCPLPLSEDTDELVQPRMPPPVSCTLKKCNHQIIFDYHYNRESYEAFLQASREFRQRNYGN